MYVRVPRFTGDLIFFMATDACSERERERERERESAHKKNSACNYDYQPICSTLHFEKHERLQKKQDQKIVAELSRNSSKFAARMLLRSLGTCEMKHEDLQVLGGSLEETENCMQLHHP